MSEARRDRHGRYLIPVPGGDVAHARCTKVVEVLDDRTLLEMAARRNVAKGIALREDLYTLAQATPLDEKGTLNRLCSEAAAAVRAGARANTGTALHTFTERLDRGEEVEVPERWRADMAAYRRCLATHGIELCPEWIEVIAVCDALSEPVAGTIDRIVRWRGRLCIGDIKTGKWGVEYGQLEWAQQLAIYSRCKSLLDPKTNQLSPIPEVDQDVAVLLHMPAGEGTCKAYEVDLNAGWEAAQLSVAVRAWRKRKDLVTPLASQPEVVAA